MIALKKLNTIIMLSLFGIAYGSTGKIKHGSHILYTDGGDNEIRCQTQALCDIALVKGDSFVNWIITDGKPWADSARKKTTYIDSDGRQHVILQATYAEANNPTILVGTEQQYHFDLTSTDSNNKVNNYIFVERNTNEYNSHNANIDNGLDINFNNKKLYGSYGINGDTDSTIRPVAVFNDGIRTYIQMQNNISVSDLPTVYTYDKDDNLQSIAGVRYRKPFFVIDGVRPRYAIITGTSSSGDLNRINIRLKKDKQGFLGIFKTQYVD